MDDQALRTCAERQSGGAAVQEIDAAWLRRLCLDAGADDVGFVDVTSPALGSERDPILTHFPRTKSLISFVCRMNRGSIRSPARSLANLEFHHMSEQVNEAAHDIVRALEGRGVWAINPSMGFPMEMDRFPDRVWVVSHKPVAVAAGLGRVGLHRMVIHPKFGSFVLLGTVLLDARISETSRPIERNPCLACKLCVAACPTGAIALDGQFDFSACYHHNYWEFMGGFADWAEMIADSRNAIALRGKLSDAEQSSLWQSLSYGANYKAAYCMAVCPAGEDVIEPYLKDRIGFTKENVKPLQDKTETVYVVAGSDAEEHVRKRFPNKTAKQVRTGLRPRSIAGVLAGLPLVFQRGKAKGLAAVYHFTFTGTEKRKATISIRNQRLNIQDGHVGRADIVVATDARAWLEFVYKERGLLGMLLRRKLRISGSPRLLTAFGKCFPA